MAFCHSVVHENVNFFGPKLPEFQPIKKKYKTRTAKQLDGTKGGVSKNKEEKENKMTCELLFSKVRVIFTQEWDGNQHSCSRGLSHWYGPLLNLYDFGMIPYETGMKFYPSSSILWCTIIPLVWTYKIYSLWYN